MLSTESTNVLESFKEFQNHLIELKDKITFEERRKIANQFMIDLSGKIEKTIESYYGFIENIYDGYSIPIKTYRVKNSSELILFAHGGENIQGNFNTHDYLCQKMAALLNTNIVAIEYRLSPEYIFPTSLNDLLSVYCFFKTKYNSEIYLSGDSAGGNLVAALNILIRRKNIEKASGQILMYPLLDNDFSTASYRKFGKVEILRPEDVKYVTSIYAGCNCTDPSVENNDLIYLALEQDLTVFPKTFMISAECDILLDSQVSFCMRLKNANINCRQEIVKKAIHGFMQYGKFFDNSVTETLRKILLWMKTDGL